MPRKRPLTEGSVGSQRLDAQRLARDFAGPVEIARQGIGTFYEALAAARHGRVEACLNRWKALVGSACGRDLDAPSDALAELAAHYAIYTSKLRPAELLLALHTYFALLVKLVIGGAMAPLREESVPLARLAHARSDRLLEREVRAWQAWLPWGQTSDDDPPEADVFAWYLAAWSEPIAALLRALAKRVSHYDFTTSGLSPVASGDLLKELYEELFPRRVRHALGEYYTPDWLAECILDEVQYSGDPRGRILDPACGSGTFLVAAIRRARAWHATGAASGDREQLCRTILGSVAGLDLNPLAVVAARANYLIAIRDLVPRFGPLEIPVCLRDAILAERPPDGLASGLFDRVVGNPPWIAWDHLSPDYRQATKPLWKRYGLFSLSGNEARHGGGKKDLSMLMTYAVADRYLRSGGRLAFVITQTLFQTKGAGDGFRRFRLGRDGDWLKVLRVNDLVAVRPFAETANWTSTILLEKGAPTEYPVPYVKWLPRVGSAAKQVGDCPNFGHHAKHGRTKMGLSPSQAQRRLYQAAPIRPCEPGSPWLLLPDGWRSDLQTLLGPSPYRAHLGANSGGANGVYWLRLQATTAEGLRVRNVVDRGKREVAAVEQVIEPDLIYPLLRWADVGRYCARPSGQILMVQDPQTRRGLDESTLIARWPRTYAYLDQFRELLSARAAFRRYQAAGPFYSMYNVGSYTLAPIKVVWRRMDRRMQAAVVEPHEVPGLGPRPVIPQETCVLIAADSAAEAHFLCALLNSSPAGFLVRSCSVSGGKGFGTPGILDFVKIPQFDPSDGRHEELSRCSRAMHESVLRGDDRSALEGRIDQLAADLWGLALGDLALIARELHDSPGRKPARAKLPQRP